MLSSGYDGADRFQCTTAWQEYNINAQARNICIRNSDDVDDVYINFDASQPTKYYTLSPGESIRIDIAPGAAFCYKGESTDPYVEVLMWG